VVLELYDAAGARVRRFASDEKPERPRDGVYFADLWLADALLPATSAGHHRFVWDLRRERPQALDYDYSIAAIPGRETPPAPQGALVSPGLYEARLSVDGEILRQPVRVVADPRVTFTADDYAELERFQERLVASLAESGALSVAVRAFEARLGAAPGSGERGGARAIETARRRLAELRAGDDPAAVNARLSGLAADLEQSDARPTAPQREVLVESRAQLDRFAARWLEFERQERPRLERRLGLERAPGAR
jgi:hypothetical protein